jgi:hypothetical protein
MRRHLFFLSALILCGSPKALATPRVAQAPSIKQLIRHGRLCYRLRNYACAKQKFGLAYAKSRSVKLLFNLAAAEDKLGNAAAALRHYRDYLRLESNPPPRAIKHLEKRLTRLMPLVARLKLTIKVANQKTPDAKRPIATVFVDNKRMRLPVEGELILPPGKHQLRIEAPAYDTEVRKLVLKAGTDLKLSIALRKTDFRARLSVTAEAGAIVYVDGKRRGKTPMQPLLLHAGEYVIEVTTKRALYRKRLTLARKQRLDLAVKLSPVQGTVSFESTPAGAEVYVDGRARGTTPLTLKNVPMGKHRVLLRRKNCLTWRSAFALMPLRARLLVKIPLVTVHPVTIHTNPIGAQVHIDGKLRGLSPLIVMLPRGGHSLALRHARHREHREMLVVPKTTLIEQDLGPGRIRRNWGLGVLGTAVASGIVGTVMWVTARKDGDNAYAAYQEATTQAARQLHRDDIRSAGDRITAGHVFLGVAAGLIGTASYLLITSGVPRKKPRRVLSRSY